jgi:alpha-1,6-mannosyltransferase
MLGEGPLKAQLQTEARARRARIIWLPYESDRTRVANLLASADAVVSPGPVETFGLSALEAMACGTPVVSVNCGAGAELVRRSGAGNTYRVRDDAHFAATLFAVLHGGEDAGYGARGRRYAEREHGWDQAFDELFAFYARLVGR